MSGDVLADVLPDVLPDGLADGAPGAFVYPDSAVIRLRWEDAVVTSGVDVDSVPNSGTHGAGSISQSTASKKPHLGADHVAFDAASAQILSGSALGDILADGDFFAAFAVYKLDAFPAGSLFIASINAGVVLAAQGSFRGKGTNTADFVVYTKTAGQLVPAVAFTDTADYHVHSVVLDAAGATYQVDDGTPVSATGTTGGVDGACTDLCIGGRIDDAAHTDFKWRDYVVLRNPTAAEIANVRAELLANRTAAAL